MTAPSAMRAFSCTSTALPKTAPMTTAPDGYVDVLAQHGTADLGSSPHDDVAAKDGVGLDLGPGFDAHVIAYHCRPLHGVQAIKSRSLPDPHVAPQPDAGGLTASLYRRAHHDSPADTAPGCRCPASSLRTACRTAAFACRTAWERDRG